MGAEQSTPSSDEKVFSSGRPISFSQDLVNHLEDTNVSSTETSPHRQGTLDAHVRARIAAELERLQAEEQSVREQIEQALERENLDRETALAKSEASSAVAETDSEDDVEKRSLASSVALQSELEEVQRKAERFHQRRSLETYPEVKDAREAVIQCYQSKTSTPLDCADVVDRFKQSVAQVEHAFVDSLR